MNKKIQSLLLNNHYILTISYGDYTRGSGGTDKAMLAQQSVYNAKGIDVIHIYPIRWGHGKYWGMCINGNSNGVFSTRRVKWFLYEAQEEGKQILKIILHHLMKINMQELKEVLAYCACDVDFFLHDYRTVCPYNGLVRNNREYCGSSCPTKEKCEGCCYFIGDNQTYEIQQLFEQLKDRITFIAPSDVAKEEWCKSYPYFENRVMVRYHQKLEGHYTGNNELIGEDDELRIAFVGYQSPLKGWSEWMDTVRAMKNKDERLQLYQFGFGDEKDDSIQQVLVDYNSNMNAMIDALREYKIHVAILWSIWPETYSYTYYEALAANAFVITNRNSGNICKQVEMRGNGVVAETIQSALADIQNLRNTVNAYRKSNTMCPSQLVENDELIGRGTMLVGSKFEKTKRVFDLSNLLSIVKKYI